MRLRAFLFVSVLVLSGPIVVARTDASDASCPGFTVVEHQGPSCPIPGGWRIRLADGTTIDTHGPDLAPSGDAAGLGQNTTNSYPPSPPSCAPRTEKHIFLVYAAPADVEDRYATFQHKLRDMVNRMNGHLRLEAQLFGDDMSYRFACDADGLVHVEHVSSDVTTANDTFSSIVNDLRRRGHSSTNAKYLVFWDAFISGVGGQGNVHNDDRLIPQNANNGGPDYALVYGYTDGWGMMTMGHEIGHNIGAVQLSSPNSSGGWHCVDGQDTMCYRDSNTTPYDPSVCTDREHYDCGHDDYFNPTPPEGSYLATHWNLASRLNVWFDFTPRANQPPRMTQAYCFDEPSSPGAPTTCGFWADDADAYFNNAGGILNFTIDWGDGTQSVVGPAPAAYPVNAPHAWAVPGNYTITVSATDNGAPPITSEALQLPHEVRCNFTSTGQLVVGTAGVETPLSARTVAVPACWGSPYTLTSTGVNDFDVCWYADLTLLQCDRQEGHNAGTVPDGTTHAHVVFFLGAAALYRLEIG